MIELMYESGADADARNKAGWTPLHFAAARGRREAAEYVK